MFQIHKLNIFLVFLEISDKHSKMKIPHDVTTKEDCNNTVALQVQNRYIPY